MFARKGMTPLVATILLVAFSVGLGALVMSWGEDYIEQKAEFVQGVQEVKIGCDAAGFSLMMIGGRAQVCTADNAINVWLDNGPNTALYNVHARIAGRDGVDVVEDILPGPLSPEGSIKAIIPYNPGIGPLLQLKLIPKLFSGGNVISCSEKPVLVEYLPPCE